MLAHGADVESAACGRQDRPMLVAMFNRTAIVELPPNSSHHCMLEMMYPPASGVRRIVLRIDDSPLHSAINAILA